MPKNKVPYIAPPFKNFVIELAKFFFFGKISQSFEKSEASESILRHFYFASLIIYHL